MVQYLKEENPEINTAILESDKLLSYDICKVIINEFDKHLYDLLDSELKKSMLY